MANSSIFGAVALVALVAVIAVGGQAALADGAVSNGVDNESIAVDYDRPVSVDEDGVEYDTTVTVRANGATLDDGTDYDWNADTGNVTWYNTTATTGGDTAEIDYAVDQLTDESRQLGQISAAMLIGVGLIVVWIIGDIAISGRF